MDLASPDLASPSSHPFPPPLVTRPHLAPVWILAGVLTLGLAAFGSVANGHEPSSAEFFEQRIRPILIQHCYECHSDDSSDIGGSLWMDSPEAMKTGGDSGPIIKPGDADASLLISAIRYESSEMPPEQPLPESVIQDFERWINAGAVDPRQPHPRDPKQAPEPTEIDLDAGRKFWAFRPVIDFRWNWTDQEREQAKHQQVESNVIDHCIDEALAEAGIVANPPADPDVILRRLAFDLTGLPPDDALRASWLAKPDAENWAVMVDRLLDSREFAQHWARHWMDVARYADSNGSDFNATFHDAWRYRDYLVDSFDQDRPVDQMIRQQVAGDLLPFDSDQQRKDNLVATTFLMLGAKMLSERDKAKLTLDVVDEQIDTVGRAFLGMTLGCARCHDHKFDPIPTEDYYALAGIFRSTQTLNGESQKYVSTFNRTELPISGEHRQALADHKRQLKQLDQQIEAAKKKLTDAERGAQPGIMLDDTDAKKTGHWVASTFSNGFIGSGYIHDDNRGDGQASVEFRTRLPKPGSYQVSFAFNSGGNRAKNVAVQIQTSNGTEIVAVDQRKSGPDAPWKVLGDFRFNGKQDAIITITNQDTQGYVIVDAIRFLNLDLSKSDADANAEAKQASHSKRLADAKSSLDVLEKQRKQLVANQPPPIPTAMAPQDFPVDQIVDSPVQIRGEVRNVGKVIPRGFLQVCGSRNRAEVSSSASQFQGSGRKELAQWLTDPENPLPSRVMVNRIWSKVFGEGIVRTVDNFGSRGERPSHPKLLDALAVDFMKQGWRVKPLVRRMVLSEAYRRSSDVSSDDEASLIDPENRLLWKAHRKRVTAESLRDTMLSVAGLLTDEEPEAPVANKGVLATKNNANSQAVIADINQDVRSIYLPIIRGNVDPLMTVLDAADPDLLVGKRPTTNVPSQALVLLNSKSVNAWADATAERIIREQLPEPEQPSGSSRVDSLIERTYQLCLSRLPSTPEWQMAQEYLGEQPDNTERLSDLVAAIFASTEFRLLD